MRFRSEEYLKEIVQVGPTTVAPNPRNYQIGDRIGQLVILELPSVEFVEGEFGGWEGGFGSSGL
jgi:dUTPase